VCLPAYAVGGDFYDHYPVRGGAVFTVADVMGKGLGAAILAASVRSALRGASRAVDCLTSDVDVAHTVNSVAAQLADDLSRTDTFVTLFHGKLDVATGRVDYIDAGHGFAVMVRRDGRVEPLSSADMPMGILPGDSWTARETVLRPGDSLLIASDGVLDLVGDGSDVRPVLELLTDYRDPADLCSRARQLHASTPPMDDVTLVAIRREAS
jgi:serine phosphatase RsbU (regulator of sigma subunit)